MLFPTHLVAGYLCTLRWRLSPYWAVAGAALPDLVDKSVAMGGFYDLYHSLGHSLAGLVIGTLVVLGLARTVRRGGAARRAGTAVLVGWTSHLALDAVHMVLNGRPGDVRFLAWPLVEHTPAVTLPPVEFALFYVGTPAFYVELFVWGLFAAVLADRPRSRRPSSVR